MNYKNIFCILVILIVSAGCFFVEISNSDLVGKAEVALRIECIQKAEACGKYCWQTVKILKVLKDESNYRFRRNTSIKVAYYNWEDGIPIGTATIYLERYYPPKDDLWKLLGGGVREGVSHYEGRSQPLSEDKGPSRREIRVINGKRIR